MHSIQRILNLTNQFTRISARLPDDERKAFRRNWDLRQFRMSELNEHQIQNIELAFQRMLREVS